MRCGAPGRALRSRYEGSLRGISTCSGSRQVAGWPPNSPRLFRVLFNAASSSSRCRPVCSRTRPRRGRCCLTSSLVRSSSRNADGLRVPPGKPRTVVLVHQQPLLFSAVPTVSSDESEVSAEPNKSKCRSLAGGGGIGSALPPWTRFPIPHDDVSTSVFALGIASLEVEITAGGSSTCNGHVWYRDRVWPRSIQLNSTALGLEPQVIRYASLGAAGHESVPILLERWIHPPDVTSNSASADTAQSLGRFGGISVYCAFDFSHGPSGFPSGLSRCTALKLRHRH